MEDDREVKIEIDLSDIKLNLDSEMQGEVEQAEDIAAKIAFDFQRNVKRRTPVKTGVARNGWDVDLSGPVPVVLNNVHYITDLNRGHSKQAPAGFVEAELDAAMRRARR